MTNEECLILRRRYQCPTCGRVPDDGDLAWNNAATEAGTPYLVLDLLCAQCDTSLAHVFSWYPHAATAAEAWDVLGAADARPEDAAGRAVTHAAPAATKRRRMSTPMNPLFSQVTWRCARCDTPLRTGCHCWDRITVEEKAVIAETVRSALRQHIRTMYPDVWAAMNRSARQSIPNTVYNAVHAALGTLNPPREGHDGDGTSRRTNSPMRQQPPEQETRC